MTELDNFEPNDYPGNSTNINQISEYIDNDFFAEAIKEQIDDSLDGTRNNYLEDFEEKLRVVKEKFQEADYEDLEIFAQSLYGNILNWIMDRYAIDVDVDSEYMVEAARKLYQFFAIDLKSLTTSFMISYINENYESIIRNIDPDKLNRGIFERIKTEVDEYKYLAATNLEEMMIQVGGTEMEFETFLRYANMRGDTEIDLTGFIQPDDSDEPTELTFWSIDDSNNRLVPIITSQITSGEYDRSVIIDISDTLMEIWDIKNHIEEKGSKAQASD